MLCLCDDNNGEKSRAFPSEICFLCCESSVYLSTNLDDVANTHTHPYTTNKSPVKATTIKADWQSFYSCAIFVLIHLFGQSKHFINDSCVFLRMKEILANKILKICLFRNHLALENSVVSIFVNNDALKYQQWTHKFAIFVQQHPYFIVAIY